MLAARPALAAPPLPAARPVGPEIIAVEDARGARFEVFPDGGYVVVWRDPDGVTLKARLFGPDDRPRGEAFVVGQVTEPSLEAFKMGWDLAALGDEDAWAFAWAQRTCEACPMAVFLSLYDGAVPRVERQVVAEGATDRYLPVVVAADGGAGPLAVGWTADNVVPFPPLDGENFSDVFARFYDLDGTPRGATFEVNEDEFEEQTLRDATFLPSGDIVFVWESYEGEAEFYDVVQRRFDTDGVPRGGEARVNQSEGVAQFAPAVTPVGTGYLVVWTDWFYTVGFDGAIVGRRFLADGTPTGPELVISPAEPVTDRDEASIASDGDGSLVLLWSARVSQEEWSPDHIDGPDGSLGGIFGRSFGALGQPGGDTGDDTGEILMAVETRGDQRAPVVRALSPHGYLALWQSRSPEGGPNRVVLRHLESPLCSGLCLDGGRFEVSATWKDSRGEVRSGTPVLRADDWGTFWFFHPANVELAVKVLDGTVVNGHFWVFYASLSNVAYTLQVVDKITGRHRSYTNPPGHFASRGDTSALPSTDQALRTAPDPPLLVPGSRIGATVSSPPRLLPLLLACTGNVVCLNGERFAVEVEWHDPLGGSGDGVGAALTADTGWFWFYRPDNPEVLVKVLDGRPLNGHFWVFYAALSNVGFTLRVTDRVTGETATYDNPLGTFASRGDTKAFAVP